MIKLIPNVKMVEFTVYMLLLELVLIANIQFSRHGALKVEHLKSKLLRDLDEWPTL